MVPVPSSGCGDWLTKKDNRGQVKMGKGYGGASKPRVRRRHWRRIHHSRLFWVGFFLFLAAITIYVFSDDLAWRPIIQLAPDFG